jgi:hypothetical protein
MDGWVGGGRRDGCALRIGWAVSEEWADRWAESEDKGGV